jgi:hypothetical protein
MSKTTGTISSSLVLMIFYISSFLDYVPLIPYLKYLQNKLLSFKLSARFLDSKNVVERIHYISLACLPSAESKELA